MKESANPFEEEGEDEVLYPRYKDPFTKRTKSVKQLRKAEKQLVKQKHKQEKKEEKARKKHDKKTTGIKHVSDEVTSTPNNNKSEKIGPVATVKENVPSRPIYGSSTLPPPTSPNGPKSPMPGYQTLDMRTTEAPHTSPVLTNKRITQLKATGGDVAPKSAPKTDTIPKKQIYVPSVNESEQESVARPNTLKLASNADQIRVAPDKRHDASPLTRTPTADNGIARVRRTPSMSKVIKDKKKKKKKLKKIFKKKKKTDRGKETNVVEDPETLSQVKMRKKEHIRLLQKEVSETEEILRNSVVNLLHQRDSMLEGMLEKSEMLEEKAYDFARNAQEAKLKQKAKSTCCGFGSKYRVCWYICACERGLKRKKKSSKQGDTPQEMNLLSPREAADLEGDTEDDCYKPAEPLPSEISANKSELSRSNATKKGGNEFTGSTRSIASKLTHIPDTIRSSLPNLIKNESPEKGGSEGAFPRRKTSSAGSAQEMPKKPTKKQLMRQQKEKEKREQSYRVYADVQFEDEETRKRAISLLRMDDKRV